MSVYASFDDGPGEQLASNLGWGDFCRWVDELDHEKFSGLTHLREHGYVDDLSGLAEELERAVAHVEPKAEGLTDTIKHFIEMINANSDSEAVFVNDGMTTANSEEGEDADS